MTKAHKYCPVSAAHRCGNRGIFLVCSVQDHSLGRLLVIYRLDVAQWLKMPGIHCYVAGSIPTFTPRYRYSTNKIRNALRSTKKKSFGCMTNLFLLCLLQTQNNWKPFLFRLGCHFARLVGSLAA
jgi:hypothetical protein